MSSDSTRCGICRGARRPLRRRGRLRDPRARPARRRAELPRASVDDDAADRTGRLWHEDPRARRFQDRPARDRGDPADVGTNRQSGAGTSRASTIRIDCRSYADQGIDREATVHLGPVASGMERNGEATDLGDRNRAAKARNAERERIEGDRAAVSAEIIDLAAERERREPKSANCARRSAAHSPPRILEVADREALDLQPRRSQPRTRQGRFSTRRNGPR